MFPDWDGATTPLNADIYWVRGIAALLIVNYFGSTTLIRSTRQRKSIQSALGTRAEAGTTALTPFDDLLATPDDPSCKQPCSDSPGTEHQPRDRD